MIDILLVMILSSLHADPDSEFSDFAIKNSINRARITMDFKNFLFLFIHFFITYHKSKFYKVSNGSVEVEIRLSITSPYSEITPLLQYSEILHLDYTIRIVISRVFTDFAHDSSDWLITNTTNNIYLN